MAVSGAPRATRAGRGEPLSSSQPLGPQYLPPLTSAAVAAYSEGRAPCSGVWMRLANILCIGGQFANGTDAAMLVAENPGCAPTLIARRSWRRKRRSEEHTSELQSLMRISYAVFCLKKKQQKLYQPQYKHQHTPTPYELV